MAMEMSRSVVSPSLPVPTAERASVDASVTFDDRVYAESGEGVTTTIEKDWFGLWPSSYER